MSAAGVVVAVCLGAGGVPKRPVQRAAVGRLGLEGDRHRFRLHGGPDRAVCLFSEEDHASLVRDGVPDRGPGAYGENLRTRGLDLGALAPGDRLGVGPEVVLELHDVREPCATLRPLDPRFPELLVGRSGWMCRVVEGGEVAPGMAVRLVPAGA